MLIRNYHDDTQVYSGGPAGINEHLDPEYPGAWSKSEQKRMRNIKACSPLPEWKARYDEVMLEIRRRERAAAVVQGTDVDQEEVVEAWLEFFVAHGIPFHAVDSPKFRRAMLLTAKAGKSCIVEEKLNFPHRTAFSGSHLEMLEQRLQQGTTAQLRTSSVQHGYTLMSDGWSDPHRKPILNTIAHTTAGNIFLEAKDTTGQKKSAQFIADFVLSAAAKIGPQHLTAVIMDGAQANQTAFKLIRRQLPQVSCFPCTAHGMNLYIQNICSGKEVVIIKHKEYAWGFTGYRDAVAFAWDAVKFVMHHQAPLGIFRKYTDKNLLGFAETRFASKLTMCARYVELHHALDSLFTDNEYLQWVAAQKPDVRTAAAKARETVRSDSHLQTTKVEHTQF